MSQTIQLPSNAMIGNSPDVLKSIHFESKNIAIYERDIELLKSELKTLSHEKISFKSSGSKFDIMDALKNLTQDKLPKNSLLIQDISDTLNLFEIVTQAKSFQLLLDTISTDMCTKFHADINQLRLLCTYVGPGTLWLADNETNSFLKGETNKINIRQVNTGSIAVLKGKLYPNAKPVQHRSPEIQQYKESRLLLRIDIN